MMQSPGGIDSGFARLLLQIPGLQLFINIETTSLCFQRPFAFTEFHSMGGKFHPESDETQKISRSNHIFLKLIHPCCFQRFQPSGDGV